MAFKMWGIFSAHGKLVYVAPTRPEARECINKHHKVRQRKHYLRVRRVRVVPLKERI